MAVGTSTVHGTIGVCLVRGHGVGVSCASGGCLALIDVPVVPPFLVTALGSLSASLEHGAVCHDNSDVLRRNCCVGGGWNFRNSLVWSRCGSGSRRDGAVLIACAGRHVILTA